MTATPRLRGRAGVEQRKRRLARNPLCADCFDRGLYRPATEVDHIKPLSKGGTDVDSNTRNLCKACHQRRTAEQFGHRPKRTIGVSGWPTE